MFELTRRSSVPLVDQIVTRIVQLVQHGQLAEGTRVPSIRKLAKLVGASAFTVADAYDRLVARGVIESRAGRGFFVARRRSTAVLAVIEAMPDPGSDALALARASLTLHSQIIAAGSGFLPSGWYAEVLPSGALSRLSRERRPNAWLPCPPQGMVELREQISARLVQRGIAASPDHLVTTFGASQAFDLLGRILLSPGDAVLVEDPGFFVLFEQLRVASRAARADSAPRERPRPRSGGSGVPRASAARLLHADAAPQPDRDERGACGVSPAAVVRGAVRLRDRRRRRVRRSLRGPGRAARADRRIAARDPRRQLHEAHRSRNAAGFHRGGRRARSRSSSSARCCSVCTGSALLESVVSEALDSGRYRRHCDRTRTRLARLRRDARTALESAGITFGESEGEGIFLWGRVPDAHRGRRSRAPRAGRLDPAREGRAVFARARQREVAALQRRDQRRAGADPLPLRGRARRRLSPARRLEGGKLTGHARTHASRHARHSHRERGRLPAAASQLRPVCVVAARTRTSSRSRSSPIRSCTATCAHLFFNMFALYMFGGRSSGCGERRSSSCSISPRVLDRGSRAARRHRAERHRSTPRSAHQAACSACCSVSR